MAGESTKTTDTVCVSLLVLFIVLLALLVYLYRRLGRESRGRYTLHSLVFGRGGLRDRARAGVGAAEARLGVRLWPRAGEDEEPVEEDRGGGDEEDSSGDYSSLEGVDLRERAESGEELKDGEAEGGEPAEKGSRREGEDDEDEEKVGLLVSDGVIWSEEKEVDAGTDLTAL